MIVAGFGLTCAGLPVRKDWRDRIAKWEEKLLPLLYAISVTQLGINIRTFIEDGYVILLCITGVFTLLVVFVLVHLIWKGQVLSHVPTLLMSSLVFNVLAFVLTFFSGAQWWVIAPYAAIGIGLLVWAILRYERIEKRREVAG